MHPNPLFRSEDRDFLDALIGEIGFGKVFLTTPDGPRVAHTPFVLKEGGRLCFHLARSNALTANLDGARALALVDGPHGYVSPRWYENRATVPTWDYVALELEGPVRKLADDELEALLHELIVKHEADLGGEAWEASETPEDIWAALLKAIAGFELQTETTRPTIKLSQKKSSAELARIAEAHAANGNEALADMMRQEMP